MVPSRLLFCLEDSINSQTLPFAISLVGKEPEKPFSVTIFSISAIDTSLAYLSVKSLLILVLTLVGCLFWNPFNVKLNSLLPSGACPNTFSPVSKFRYHCFFNSPRTINVPSKSFGYIL